MFLTVLYIGIIVFFGSSHAEIEAPEGFIHLLSKQPTQEGDSIGTLGLENYFLSQSLATWQEAILGCQYSSIPGLLVSIRDVAQLNELRDAIISKISTPAYVWTSGAYDEPNWVFATTDNLRIHPNLWYQQNVPVGYDYAGVYLYVGGFLTSQRYLATSSIYNRYRYVCYVSP